MKTKTEIEELLKQDKETISKIGDKPHYRELWLELTGKIRAYERVLEERTKTIKCQGSDGKTKGSIRFMPEPFFADKNLSSINDKLVYLYFLSMANHKKNDYVYSWHGESKTITVNRGERITGKKSIANAIKISEFTVSKVLTRLIKKGYLERVTIEQNSIYLYRVLKYDNFVSDPTRDILYMETSE